MAGTGGELQCRGMAPASRRSPFGRALGEDLKAPACVDGQQGKAAAHNCSAGAAEIAGTLCHVLSPALSPGKD